MRVIRRVQPEGALCITHDREHIWLGRWHDGKEQAMYALTPEGARMMVAAILNELDVLDAELHA